MQGKSLHNELSVTYELFKKVELSDFEYVYRGDFSQTITKRILALVEHHLKKFTDSASLQNRIYFIMVELMQNITRHQDITEDKPEDKNYMPIFAIEKKGDFVIITTANIVLNEKVEQLKQKLYKVNYLNKDKLKKLHRLVLSTGEISKKGGAGLGLIEMVRRSGNKLLFDFENIDGYRSYFYLQSVINIRYVNNNNTPEETYGYNGDSSIKYTKELNRLLIRNGIFLNFSGFFNRKNIFSLLFAIQGQIRQGYVSKTIYYIIIEMLQNISKHGENPQHFPEGKVGIFYIKHDNNYHTLSSGNYVKNSQVEHIKQNLDKINQYNDSELSENFNKTLVKQTNVNTSKAGLGFIDIRLKSKEKIGYNFVKVNDDYSFFTLQVFVKDIK